MALHEQGVAALNGRRTSAPALQFPHHPCERFRFRYSFLWRFGVVSLLLYSPPPGGSADVVGFTSIVATVHMYQKASAPRYAFTRNVSVEVICSVNENAFCLRLCSVVRRLKVFSGVAWDCLIGFCPKVTTSFLCASFRNKPRQEGAFTTTRRCK